MWWRTTGNVHWMCLKCKRCWFNSSTLTLAKTQGWDVLNESRHSTGLDFSLTWWDAWEQTGNHYGHSCIIIGSLFTPVCRASSSSLQRVSGVKCAGVLLTTDQWLFHRGLLVCEQSVTAQQGVTTWASSLCRMAHPFLLVWSIKWWDCLRRRSSVFRGLEVKLVYEYGVCVWQGPPRSVCGCMCVCNLLPGLIALCALALSPYTPFLKISCASFIHFMP